MRGTTSTSIYRIFWKFSFKFFIDALQYEKEASQS